MSWLPAEVWRRGGTGGARARGRGLQGDDVIHGQDQGGGGFRDALARSSAHPQPAPGRRSWGADCGFLVTALATPGEKKQAKATGGEKSRVEGLPGSRCGGLASPAHTHRGSPARARDVTRGRGTDLLFGTQTLPIRGRGRRVSSKGEVVGAEEAPTGESGSLRSLPLFPHLLGAHPWAGPAAWSAGGAGRTVLGMEGAGGEASGLGRDCVGAAGGAVC